MQNSSFFKIVTIAITATIMPITCMENPLGITEKPTITVKLRLSEKPQSELLLLSRNKRANEIDKQYCSVLGIPWEKDDNPYNVDYALFKNPGEPCDHCWTNIKPKNLPLSKISKNLDFDALQSSRFPRISCTTLFPYTLPASFVQELTEKGSMTLKNTKFAEPVEIIVTLDSIRKDPSNILRTFDTLNAKNANLVKSDDIQDVKNMIKETTRDTRSEKSKRQPAKKPTSSTTRKYIVLGGVTLSIAGLVAWLIHLHHNNQLNTQFTQITDFVRNLTNNRI